jgi:lipase chaperone LimK
VHRHRIESIFQRNRIQSMRPKRNLSLFLLITAALAFWAWQGRREPSVPTGSDPVANAIPAPIASDHAVATPAATATAAHPEAGATPTAGASIAVPTSLADTDIDGAVELDASGQLRPSLSLRRLFDQVLSSIGELSIEQIRQWLSERLDQITSADGKRQAMAAFERYLRYLRSVDAANTALSTLPPRERLAALNGLRRQALGLEMADAFFADEEAYQRFTLDRRELAEQSSLTPAERESRERELIAQLPENAREPYLAQLRTDADLADASAIDTLASDANERYRLRAERFGEEAAARMELLDVQRQAWDQRVAGYRAERARLQSGDAAARSAALADYLSRNFSEAEQRRIRSLEEVGGL